MSVPSQGGQFSIGIQAGKAGNGAYTPPATFLGTRALRVAAGAMTEEEQIPFQVGGGITPPGQYRYGQFGIGSVESVLHVDEYLTSLLTAVMGAKTTTVGAKWDNTTNAPEAAGTTVGVNTHVYGFNASSDYELPWLSARYKVPGSGASSSWGEELYDGRVSSFAINVPGAGLVTSQLGFTTRRVNYPLPATVDAWSFANTLGDSTNCVTSGTGFTAGYIKIGGTSYPLVQASISIQNNLTGPQQEHIIGSPYLDDLVPLSRLAQIRVVLKWENDDLYRLIHTGSGSGTAWSSNPFITDIASTEKGFDLKLFSPGTIAATGVPFMFKAQASRVAWRVEPIELGAQNIINVPLTGTVLAPASGNPYLQFALTNAVA